MDEWIFPDHSLLRCGSQTPNTSLAFSGIYFRHHSTRQGFSFRIVIFCPQKAQHLSLLYGPKELTGCLTFLYNIKPLAINYNCSTTFNGLLPPWWASGNVRLPHSHTSCLQGRRKLHEVCVCVGGGNLMCYRSDYQIFSPKDVKMCKSYRNGWKCVILSAY